MKKERILEKAQTLRKVSERFEFLISSLSVIQRRRLIRESGVLKNPLFFNQYQRFCIYDREVGERYLINQIAILQIDKEKRRK